MSQNQNIIADDEQHVAEGTTVPSTEVILASLLEKYNDIQRLFYEREYIEAINAYKILLKDFSDVMQRRIRERMSQRRDAANEENGEESGENGEENEENGEDGSSSGDEGAMPISDELLQELIEMEGELDEDDDDEDDAEERLEQMQEIPDEVRAIIRQQIQANAARFGDRQENEAQETKTAETSECATPVTENSEPHTSAESTTTDGPIVATKLPTYHKMIREYERMQKTYKSNRRGCQHYERNLQIKSPCCGKYYGCRRCHDENEPMHEIDRYAIRECRCLVCNTEQKVAENCINCGIRFAEYVCLKCNLFARPKVDTDAEIFHCDKCGLCRVGDPEKYFHCDTCNLCIAVTERDSHQCVKDVSRRDCPVCFEDLHSSTRGLIRVNCGHFMHPHCLQGMLKNGNFRCPICAKSLIDVQHLNRQIEAQIQYNPMPKEYERKAKILCNECSKYSIADFHFVAMKCKHCGCYNTSEVSDIPKHRESEAMEESSQE